MPGRHQAARKRRRLRLRWLAGVAGGAVVGATLLAFSSAGATPDPVDATFSVTGVAAHNCPVSAGGSDVYVAPGQDLEVESSFTGISLLSGLIHLDLGDMRGKLVIDPKSDKPVTLSTTGTLQKVPSLAGGNHPFKWTATDILGLPLTLTSSAASAGAQLSWSGTIHVTSDRTKCGVAVQLPSVSASASVSGLPPVGIGVPGVKVSVPVNVPTSLPGLGGHKTTDSAKTSAAPAHQIGNPIPVPAEVVPGANGGGLLGGGNYGPGVLPGSGSGAGAAGGPASAASSASQAAAHVPDQNSTGKDKTINLASGKASSTGEVWVVLAILAVIALAFVAATYARLYLMRSDSSD
jgi:hypothetical protein